jgi:hypothetical protein
MSGRRVKSEAAYMKLRPRMRSVSSPSLTQWLDLAEGSLLSTNT